MEEMISKVSAGIEKAKADIISVIDENPYSQPSQPNRLQSGSPALLLIVLLQIPPRLLFQPFAAQADGNILEQQPALETVQSLHRLDCLQGGRDQSERGGPSG